MAALPLTWSAITIAVEIRVSALSQLVARLGATHSTAPFLSAAVKAAS
jgi:hypothetical protein